MFAAGALAPSLIAATVLAVALFPGFLLTVPPLPKDATHDTLEKRVWRTGKVTLSSVLVHALIFMLAFGAVDYFILKRYSGAGDQ
jgi:hypothetical protein